MLDRFVMFWKDESGVAMPEYALILALVSVGLLTVLIIFRDSIGLVFDKLAGALRGPTAVGQYQAGS